MSKDYHKGKKINAYIPDELYQALEECALIYGTTKSKIIVDALYSFIGAAARDSIKKAYKGRYGLELNDTQNEMLSKIFSDGETHASDSHIFK